MKLAGLTGRGCPPECPQEGVKVVVRVRISRIGKLARWVQKKL